MRVINFDGFYNDLNDWVTEEDKNAPPNQNWYVSVLMTAEDNEMKAVPIEWLIENLPKYDDYIHMYGYPRDNELMNMAYDKGHVEGWQGCCKAIRDLLKEWEKENEE